MKISRAEFNKVHRIKLLRDALGTTLTEYRSNIRNVRFDTDQALKTYIPRYSKLELLMNEINRMALRDDIPLFRYADKLTPEEFDLEVSDSLSKYFDMLDSHFSNISNKSNDIKDRFFSANSVSLKKLENDYFNYKLQEIVTKPYERKKILEYENTLIQNTDPVFLEPDKKGPLSFRTHFFAPSKYFLGIKTDTFTFNIALVLLMSVILYLTLYFEILGRGVNFIDNIKFRKK
jgi:hypothetical protein